MRGIWVNSICYRPRWPDVCVCMCVCMNVHTLKLLNSICPFSTYDLLFLADKYFAHVSAADV